MRFSLLLLLALTFLNFSGCKKSAPVEKAGGRSKMAPPVIGFIVKPSLLKQVTETAGTLKAMDEVVLMPETQGRIVALNIPEGRPVKEGTLLVKLFDGELQAQLSKLEALFKINEATVNRQAELMKIGGVSQVDYDNAVFQMNGARADIDILKAQIRKTEIRAPFNGTVGLTGVSVGAPVTPSTPIAVLRSVNRLKLDFSLPEKQSSLLKVGQKVSFVLTAGDKPFTATVVAAEPGIDASTRNRKFRAVVAGTDARLVAGAFVSVHIPLINDANALLVPTQCILPMDQTQQVVLSRNGKAVLVPVITGVRLADHIQILRGISFGDTLAASGLQFIKPGMPLKFIRMLGESRP